MILRKIRSMLMAKKGLSHDGLPLKLDRIWYVGNWAVYEGDCLREQAPLCSCGLPPRALCHREPGAGWDAQFLS